MTLEQAITIEIQGKAFYFSYHVTFKYVNSLFAYILIQQCTLSQTGM